MNFDRFSLRFFFFFRLISLNIVRISGYVIFTRVLSVFNLTSKVKSKIYLPLFEKFLYADMHDGCLTFQKPND